jgi:hypothetical protein
MAPIALVLLEKYRPRRTIRSGCMPRACNLRLGFPVNPRNFKTVN